MNSKEYFPGFKECINLISSDDPMTFEDGYNFLLPRIKEYGDQLVKLIEQEESPKIKSRLIELLGECDDPKYITVFEQFLASSDHDVVSWSLTSLEKLSTGEGEKIADEFRKQNQKWAD